MALLVTDAVVLHGFDYLETSRIFRLLTREAGVQSVLAKGVRRSRRRFGSALDLFAGGSAEIHTKPGRDLNTLAGFDVVRSRADIALDLGRFTAAAAIAEMVLRFAGEDAGSALFDAVVGALDGITAAVPDDTRAAALAGAWRVVAELGFAPTVDFCVGCHAGIAADASVAFTHPGGGALCTRCVRLHRASRTLPAPARDALRTWVSGGRYPLADPAETRAHQRLLREFLVEHLADGRDLRAFDVWERERWEGA